MPAFCLKKNVRIKTFFIRVELVVLFHSDSYKLKSTISDSCKTKNHTFPFFLLVRYVLNQHFLQSENDKTTYICLTTKANGALSLAMKKERVVIIIPVHLPEPSPLEKISLQQTFTVLRSYPIVFMAPLRLNTSWYEALNINGKKATLERFDWQGYEAYSMLQTKPFFYHRFLKYEYMLTCHMDAFVFRDELEPWCQLNYDYIGSVIYNKRFKMKDTFFKIVTTYTNPDYFGNGGFALKKVETFYRITSRYKFYINFYHWQRKLRKRGFYDDLFHSLHYPKLFPKFRTAPKELAQQFGADFVNWDEAKLPFSNRDFSSLPFGIHGWIKNQQDYWKPCIESFGFEL